jgi:hypothetical protein
MKTDKYDQRIIDIAKRANEMRSALLEPVVDQNNGEFIGNRVEQDARLKDAAKGSVYENMGEGASTVLATHSKSLQRYCTDNGMPSDELLASAHKSIENAMLITESEKQNRPGGIFESAEISTTEGILMRDRMVALILPVMLQSVTSRMVTFIPGDYNQSEMFRVRRVAGSNFGDLSKGDIIDYDYNSRYSVMDQRWQAPSGDGTKTGSTDEFQLDSATVFGTAYPFKHKSVKILHDHDIVAEDNGSGSIFGSFLVGETTVNVTGTVDYATGTVSPVFSVAPASGIEIHIGFDVDIEKDPALIPRVDHTMEAETLYPHESAISANTTLQALWGLRREYNLNADNMAMQAMRNLLSADKDRKILRDLYFFAKGETEWNMTVPSGTYYHEHYETVKEELLNIDTYLIGQNGFSGLVGLVADPKASAIFRSLKAPFFTPAPGYRKLAQPHYVGRLFGMWDLYEDPAAEEYTALCFAKGSSHGEAGYVAGDAIPALSFKHPTMTDLTYRSTLWDLGYRDLNPFYGRKCFTKLKITTA